MKKACQEAHNKDMWDNAFLLDEEDGPLRLGCFVGVIMFSTRFMCTT